MAISNLWPKPPRWPIQPGTVDPGQRWVWHTRPRFILPIWEHADAGAAERYVRLAPTRRTARTWQLNTGAAATRTRYGPGVSIPTDNGDEIEALAGSNPSFAAWEQNEPYTIALVIKGRSGGTGTKHLYRSGSSSTVTLRPMPRLPGHPCQPPFDAASGGGLPISRLGWQFSTSEALSRVDWCRQKGTLSPSCAPSAPADETNRGS